MVCRTCGRENDAGARFCSACGAALEPRAAGAETRKVVTVVFTDVAGSTALGEALDPESLRRGVGGGFRRGAAGPRGAGGGRGEVIRGAGGAGGRRPPGARG